MCTNHITVVNVADALVKQTIPPDLIEYNYCDENDVIDDPVLTFALSFDDELLVSGHKSGLIKLWKWRSKLECIILVLCDVRNCLLYPHVSVLLGGELLKSWKGQHKGPLMKLAFNETSSYIASGSIDSTIRVWDIENHSCNFKLGGVEGITR